MKYCPYCGASLLEDAAFCMECGKTIPVVPVQNQSKSEKKQPANKEKKPRRHKEQKPKPEETKSATEPQKQDDGYDGYYNDVLPTDNGAGREKMDKELIKRIILVGTGALLVIGLAIAIMQLI